MTLILSDSNLLRNCENIFKEPSEKSIPKKVVTRSKQKRHSSVNLQKRFMKNNKPTHCQEEIKAREGCVWLRINRRVT